MTKEQDFEIIEDQVRVIRETLKEINEYLDNIREATIELNKAAERRGHWVKDSDTAFYWKCSECGAYLFWRKEEYLLRAEDELNYCPNCGAKMEETKE